MAPFWGYCQKGSGRSLVLKHQATPRAFWPKGAFGPFGRGLKGSGRSLVLKHQATGLPFGPLWGPKGVGAKKGLSPEPSARGRLTLYFFLGFFPKFILEHRPCTFFEKSAIFGGHFFHFWGASLGWGCFFEVTVKKGRQKNVIGATVRRAIFKKTSVFLKKFNVRVFQKYRNF